MEKGYISTKVAKKISATISRPLQRMMSKREGMRTPREEKDNIPLEKMSPSLERTRGRDQDSKNRNLLVGREELTDTKGRSGSGQCFFKSILNAKS